MIFSSLLFTFMFLPLMIFLYYIAKDKYRNYILLVASLMFYTYGEPKFAFVMVSLILFNYGMGLLIDFLKRKEKHNIARNIMFFSVIVNIGILFIYKYLDFSITILNRISLTDVALKNIVLPIGISFFTFQALSYVIDVYRGTVEVQKNPAYLMLYVSFFPQLIAGPIVRYSTIEYQICNRTHTLEKFAEGVKRFFIGFSKKVILSNNLSMVATAAFDLQWNVADANIVFLWLGAICYSLQIYYDFSGYSDMAIGLGKMFGFEFEENFDYPYISQSVTEFWRRWHISLGQWFRDYVYIPLGGSRVSVCRHIFNLFVVWACTGIWHGANYTFVAWGLFYFILLMIEKFCVKPEKRRNIIFTIMWRIVTLLCVNFGWVIFNAGTLKSGIRYCLAMLGRYNAVLKIDNLTIYYLREYGVFVVAGIIFATPVLKVIARKMDKVKQLKCIKDICAPIGCGLLFLWSVSFLILGAHNPFIYFNF